MSFVARFDPGSTALWMVVLVILEVTVVVLTATFIARTASRWRAAVRHRIWICALACTLVAPAAVAISEGMGWTIPIIPSMQRTVPVTVETKAPPEPNDLSQRESEKPAPTNVDMLPSEFIATEPAVLEANANFKAPLPQVAEPAARMTIQAVRQRDAVPQVSATYRTSNVIIGAMIFGWGLGVVLGLGRFALGWFRLGALRKSLQPFEPGERNDVLDKVRLALNVIELPPIATSNQVSSPVAIGFPTSIVVFPQDLADKLTPRELRDILIHECAHVLRRDILVGLLQRLAAIVYWPHPLVHSMNAQLSRAREEVCDNYVLRGGDPCGYARTLLDLTERCQPGRVACAGVGLMDVKWTLSDRIAGLLDPRRDSMTRANRRAAVIAPLLLFGACLAIAGLRPIGPSVVAAQPPAKAKGEAIEPRDVNAKPLSAVGAPDRIVRGVVVDEAGQPVAGASVRLLRADTTRGPVDTDADGKFAIRVHGYMLLKEELIASANDGALQGVGTYNEPQSSKPAKPVTLTVKPSRSVVVHVRDPAGNPVADAAVEALSYEYNNSGKTAASGDVTLRIAADAEVRWIVGLKAKVGFDYYENYRQQRSMHTAVLPAEVSLVLDGARTTVVKAVDSAGQPVPNVSFCPWTIFKPGKVDYANIGGSPIVNASTDKNGLATFDWLPTRFDQGISFLTIDKGYSCPERPHETSELDSNQIQAKLLRDTPVRGTVRFADGRPAPGILLVAEGTHETCRMRTRTAEDGTYGMAVYPDQSYMIGVFDDEFAARTLTGIIVREGKALSGLDLTLGEGTLLHGHVTKPRDTPWYEDDSVTIMQLGAVFPNESNGSSDWMRERENLFRSAAIDAKGHYQFRIGPGQYSIWRPYSKGKVDLIVESEKEIVRDFSEANGNPSRTMKGVATEESATGDKPIPGAFVEFATTARGHSADRTLADDQGVFHFTGVTDGPALVYVRNKEGTLAGFTFVDKDFSDVRAAASKASHVRGRVVDERGQPLAGRQVRAWFDDKDYPMRTGRFSANGRTDAEGRYRFSGMPVGSAAEVMVTDPSNSEPGKSGYVSKKTAVINTDGADVPDLVVPVANGNRADPKMKQAGGAGLDVNVNVDVNAKAIASRSALPSRAEMEAIVRAIGREPVTPELIDLAWLMTFPEFKWSANSERIKAVVADTGFLQRIDEVSQAVSGHPADTLTILGSAIAYHVGDDIAMLQDSLRQTIELAKKPVSPVRGKVVEAGTGKPIVGALVYVSDALARTDASGAFFLKPLTSRPNGGLVWVRADGFATSAFPVLKATHETVDLQAEMSADQPIVGRVVDSNDKPIAGANVWAMMKENDFTLPRVDPTAKSVNHQGVPLEVLTDSNGQFSFRGLPVGFEISWYRFRHPEYQSIDNSLGTLKAGEPLAIRMEPGCKVAGSVVDELGRPISLAMVEVRSPGQPDDVFRTFTTADGKFRFGGAAPGRWTLVIQPEKNAPVIGTVVAIPGKPVENQYVVGLGAYIVGKVVDQDGKPVARAAIGWAQPVDERGEAVEALELGRMTSTAENGSFRLGPLSKEEYQLTGLASGPRQLGKTKARSNQDKVLIRLVPDPIK